MEAFATVDEYDARFTRTASGEMCEECLMDATYAIAAELDARGIPYDDPSEDFAERLMRTCRSVANRLMPSGSGVPVGVTQMSTTAGSYSETMSYTPSYGTAKLLDSELRMLGIGAGRVGWARLGGHDD